MNLILRVVLGLAGAGGLLVALTALADPLRVAELLAIRPEGSVGLGSLRGDLAGFFGVFGGFTLAAAVRNQRALLAAPLALMALALTGRLMTGLTLGFDPAHVQLMIVEAGGILLLAVGMRALNR